MLNLSSVLSHSAAEHPEKVAVIFGDQQLTFGQLDCFANQIANSLVQAGIKKGDKVAISCLNLPFFPMVYYGILKAGAVVVPLNVLLKAREIAYHLKDSEASAYFCFQGTPDLPMAEEGYEGFKQVETCKKMWIITADPSAASPIEEVVTMNQLVSSASSDFEMMRCDPGDTAAILYTSGTTGFPKGAELSHSNLLMNVFCCRDLLELQREDVQILVLPLFHTFGQIVQMNAGFSMGNTMIFIARFTPEAVLDAIVNKKATLFAGVPTMYWQLLTYKDTENKYDVEIIADTLRIGISGGASLPVEVLKGIEEKYNIPILEGYGLSETSPVATFNYLHKERKIGSIGVPIWGVELKVFNEDNEEVPVGEIGEIVIRGHNVMKGYYNKAEATAEAIDRNGWFHSGDLGRIDEDGCFYIVDRVKDMIIRGGFNVYPREIEEVLMTHPSISLASVVGVPHEQHGEEVKAFIVLKEKETTSEAEIIKWSKENMAAYKYPRMIEMRENLPMTATGKILKQELKD
jgi:long-chain acyl-CoA synthetase